MGGRLCRIVQVEEQYLEVLRRVKSCVDIPVAVKLNPYFSSTAHMCQRLVEAGADGLVLFNRFYQPDIDLAVHFGRQHDPIALAIALGGYTVFTGEYRPRHYERSS